MSPVRGSSHRFITTFYSFYHQMYSVCRRKHFKGELSLSGDILMGFLYTGQSIHFLPISSKSSYFTLLSTQLPEYKDRQQNIFDLFRLLCFPRSGINSFNFQYSFSSKIHLQFSFSLVVRVWHLGIVQTCLHPLWNNSTNVVNHLQSL